MREVALNFRDRNEQFQQYDALANKLTGIFTKFDTMYMDAYRQWIDDEEEF